MTLAVDGKLIVAGGESGNQKTAHAEVEVFVPQTNEWQTWPNLNQGRHGTGLAVINGFLYTASGCGNRGGSPELKSLERLELKP